jgi:N-acetylglucosaminyl-diphospho-decaprenol L-rhamnosyltransferase
VALVLGSYPWVHLIANRTNLGYVAANNLAIQELRPHTSLLWLLNPDTIVPPGTLSQMLSFVTNHPRAGLVGPKLLNPDGTLQECAFHFPGVLQALFSLDLMPRRLYYSSLNGRYPRAAFELGSPFQIDHPLGAAMLVRSEAVEEVGCLDPRFFMYCEEIDWAWRLESAGWERWLLPGAAVIHVGGASTQQAKPETTKYLWESRAHLYRKHRSRSTRLIVSLAVRCVFAHRRRRTEDRDWVSAYEAIMGAWR